MDIQATTYFLFHFQISINHPYDNQNKQWFVPRKGTVSQCTRMLTFPRQDDQEIQIHSLLRSIFVVS